MELLDLSYNRLTGHLNPDLANLVSLRELYLDANRLNGELPDDWAALPQLRKLVRVCAASRGWFDAGAGADAC